MRDDVHRSLQAQRNERVDQASRRLLDGESTREIEADLEEIEAYDKLLASMALPRKRAWIGPVAVAVICVGVAGFLWSVRVRRTNVSITVETNSMRLALAKPWRIDDAFRAPAVHVERLASIHAPNLGLNIDASSPDAWFELSGGTAKLESLEIDRGAEVEIDTDRDQVTLYAGGTALRGKVAVSGNVTVSAGPRAAETTVHQSFKLDIPETVEFAVLKPQRVPTQLSMHAPAAWSLRRLSAERLRFDREDATGAGERLVISGVKSGSLRFDDTTWPAMELREGDMVGVHPGESAVLMSRSDNQSIHVSLSGLVSEVRMGDGASQRTIAPSYLEYLYSQKSLSFFWGAVVFLWGLIWSVRNTVFR